MRALGSMLMSMIAVLVSGFTTFLTFFDERYTLTSAVVEIRAGTQQGSGYTEDTGLNVTYQHYVTPSFILSNRGTRALVLTDIELVRSGTLDTCESGDEIAAPLGPSFEPMIIDADSVHSLAREFNISRVTRNYPARRAPASAAERLSAEYEPETWCITLTVFDHRGRRMEPTFEAMTAERIFDPLGPDDAFPRGSLEIEHPIAANQLLSKGAVF